MRGDLSNGPANERLFFQRAGPANESYFYNEPDRDGKREMSFKTPGPGYKKSKTKDIAPQSGPTNLLFVIYVNITECVSQSAYKLLFS